MAVSVPTKRFSGKERPNPSNSKVVKSILKKDKNQAPGKSKKVQLPPEKVSKSSKAVDPKKVKKAKDEVEKSLKLEAMQRLKEKEQEKKKSQKLSTSKDSEKAKVSKNNGKKAPKKGAAKEDVEPKTDYGRKNSIPVKYVPCKRKEVETMFRTPSPKRSGGASSVSSQTSRRGKAPEKDASKDAVKKMEALLEESDNGCSDLDDILQGLGSRDPSESEQEGEVEEEGSEEGDAEEGKDSDVEAEEQEEAEDEDAEEEDDDDQQLSEEESEEDDESENESEKGDHKDGEKVKKKDRSEKEVQAAPKKRPQPSSNKDKTEQVEPVTFREKVITKLSDWLGVAAKSRTASITLSSLEFADELAKKLINHALTMEKTYLRINEAVKDKRTNEKDYEAILSNMTEKLNANEKLQAAANAFISSTKPKKAKAKASAAAPGKNAGNGTAK